MLRHSLIFVRGKTADLARLLEQRGIKPSPRRLAVARHVLQTEERRSADQVWKKARKALPGLSRGTVYSTLNLLVRKGLIRRYASGGGGVVFGANAADHHHFIQEDSGRIHDLPLDAVAVSGLENLRDFEVREYHVVMRGRRMVTFTGNRPGRKARS